MIGPDGRPPVFDGAAWVSSDRRYWWNGAAWQPIKKPGFRPPIAVTLIVIVVVVAGVYAALKLPKPPPPAYGVTNAKIDSSTQFEFDYRRPTPCTDLSFDYVFFDGGGQKVDNFADEKHESMPANRTIHFTIYTLQAIDSHAKRFDATPTCHV